MKIKTKTVFLILATLCVDVVYAQNWPQAAGPNGGWKVETEETVPASFNVVENKNILWKKSLEESGQSGIAVWEDRIFLSILKPYEDKGEGANKVSDIRALCIDASGGDTIWEYEIEGTNASYYMYGFSDPSSPTPITDGKFVWFTNAAGKLVCLDWNGELVWERSWRSATDVLEPEKPFPFNKQFEPFLVGDTLVHMETYDSSDGKRVKGWNYLYGLDKTTGDVKWISEDALTHYNTPGYSLDALGKPTVMIGRGGYHNVPETPIGLSMIDLSDGKRIWQTELSPKSGTALYNASFTKDYAVWISESESQLTVLDSHTGEIIKTVDLRSKVDLRRFDPILERYVVDQDFDLSKTGNPNVFPAWYSNILVGDDLYFMCFKDDKKIPLMKRYSKLSPLFSFGCVNLVTDKVEYLEVPVHYNDRGEFLWREELKTTALNSRGIDTVTDQRSKRDGWFWCFNGNPIQVNDVLFFTTMIGNCYSFRTGTEIFDENAFIDLSPLGIRGESWSLNTPSYANGKLYHRTAKELICISED